MMRAATAIRSRQQQAAEEYVAHTLHAHRLPALGRLCEPDGSSVLSAKEDGGTRTDCPLGDAYANAERQTCVGANAL
jgi:hypothetical protein